jgi:hypothetical protein
MLVLIIGVMWSAIKNGSTGATLTENETQVLTAAFGGIFGILGAYVGYHAGNGHSERVAPHTHDDELVDDEPVWPNRGEDTMELP